MVRTIHVRHSAFGTLNPILGDLHHRGLDTTDVSKYISSVKSENINEEVLMAVILRKFNHGVLFCLSDRLNSALVRLFRKP